MSVAYRNTAVVLVSLTTKDFRYLEISEQSVESFWIMLGAEQLDATSNTTAYIDDISLHEGWIVDRKCPEQEKQHADGYRYGFNGKEKINGVYGRGNSLDFGERIYDSRSGRFLSVDRLISIQPSYSSYLYAGNKPIVAIDRDGDIEIIVHEYTLNEKGKYVKTWTYSCGLPLRTVN